MASLLGLNGHKILLLEKGPHIGGSIGRFYRKKIPFDIGLHFSGGLHEGGIFNNVLKILGLNDFVKPLFFPEGVELSYIFEAEGKEYLLPTYGVKDIKDRLIDYFPAESKAIDKYFQMVQDVCDNTAAMDLGNFSAKHRTLDEDFASLDEVLQTLTPDPLLRGLISAYAMCYGVKPSEISFANHARMCMNYYESIATLEGGGGALLDAFKEIFKKIDIDIRCNASIAELAEINDSRVNRFVLNTGEEVAADNCVFTIHPQSILELIPEKSVSKAFRNRVASFEPSMGFFVVFAALDDATKGNEKEPNVVSIFPHSDVNRLLDPHYKGEESLFVIRSLEKTKDGNLNPLQLLQPAFPGDTQKWEGSIRGQRPQEYLDYKAAKVEKIKAHYFKYFPRREDGFNLIDSASMLTFKDYLNNHDGCAYGIKQKIGQFNLVGKLPLLNLFAAGQSAVLPGVVGAMMSSFIVSKTILDKDQYERLVGKYNGT